MTRKDIERFEAKREKREILQFIEDLSDKELIRFSKLMKDYKRIDYVLDFLKQLK